MSLKKTFKIKGNANIKNALIKVETVLQRSYNVIELTYSVYADADEKEDRNPVDTEKLIIKDEDYNKFFSETEIKKSGNSLRSQAYKYLLSLDEFDGAETIGE